jgi:hypothetical protein
MILHICIRYARLRALFLTIAMSLSVVSVFAQAPTFVRTDYQQLGNHHVAGDFNGDGSLDLAGEGAQAVAVLLNNGAGTFGARVEYPVAGWIQDLAAGDFNGDGSLDLVVTINDPNISLSLLAGNGDGTFRAPVNFANTSGFDSPAVVAVDLNNDGKLDIVVAHEIACFTAPCIVARTISVMLGNGDGTFQPTREIEVGTGMSKVAVGDFNRDGIKDLAIAGDSARVYRLFGVGDGTFIQQPTLTLTADTFGVDATDIAVADVNGDAIEDLVVAIALNGSRTAILIGNGDGTFRPPLILTEPNLSIPQYQAVADYNGDGFQDLALALGDGSFGLMEILNGNGDGTFQPPVMYLVPPNQSSLGGVAIIAADFNADGKPDIALGIGGASPTLAVLRNSTGVAPPPTPAAPTLLSPADGATVAQPVIFDWNDVPNATSYELQVDNSSTIASPFVANLIVSVSQATIGGLPAQRLWWRVRARNSAGVFGPFSATRRFTAQAAPATATLASMSVNPTSVVGPNSSTGTATLTAAAPTGGAVVTLSSSTPAVAPAPASVTVPAGATSATFPVTTTAVSTSTAVTLTGTYSGTSRTTTLTVTPVPPPASLNTLTLTPTSVTGGTTSQGTVTLTSAAPTGGAVVSLSSSNTTVATIPASVTVSAGTTSANFTVTTSSVTTSTAVSISGSYGGTTRSATLTVTPPAANVTLTVTATGRSGERVMSSPAGINVTVGSTAAASFATKSSITLSASNNRDVIWSGACSSGGNKTKTCTFTITGNASVTGNVQ